MAVVGVAEMGGPMAVAEGAESTAGMTAAE